MSERYTSYFSSPKNRLKPFTVGGKTTTLMEVALINGLSNYLIPLIAKYDNDEDYLKSRGWPNFVEYLKQIKKYYENNSGIKGLTFQEILRSEFNNSLLPVKWTKMRAIDKGRMINFMRYLDENPEVLRPKKPLIKRDQTPEPEKREVKKVSKTIPKKKKDVKQTVTKYRR